MCGEILLQHYNQSTQMLENGISEIQNLAGLDYGSVHVGVSGDVFIKHLVRDFLMQHPETTMTCLLQSQEQMEQSLQASWLHRMPRS